LVAADVKKESTGLIGAQEEDSGVKEPPAKGAQEVAPPADTQAAKPEARKGGDNRQTERFPTPAGSGSVRIGAPSSPSPTGLEVGEARALQDALASFFPLAVLILAVLGSIVLGLATPTKRRRSARSADCCSRCVSLHHPFA